MDSQDFEKDIFDTPSDNKQAVEESKKLLLPAGWYVTEVPTLLTPERRDDGRRVARYFATLINKKDSTVTGKLGFRVSPDLRASEKDPEKADWNYRMYLQARKAFIKATGAEPTTDAEVVRYLAEYPIAVRVVQTEDAENMIVAIDAVRE